MSETATEPRVISALVEAPSAAARASATLHLDHPTYDRSLDCVHCGLCLPACPTYTQNGL